MPFKAVVHFSGAGIAHLLRDEAGGLDQAFSLFPSTRKPHVAQHVPRICFAGRHLDDGLLGRFDHHVLPGSDGTGLLAIDLIDATLIGNGRPRAVLVRSDKPRGLEEDESLARLWDATGTLRELAPNESHQHAVVVEIQDGQLGSEDPIPGLWGVGSQKIDSPYDRMTVSIDCDEKLVIEMDPLPTLALVPAGEPVVHLSFTNLPERHYDTQSSHFPILVGSVKNGGQQEYDWPRPLDAAATNPPPWCPYVRFESTSAPPTADDARTE